MCIIIPWIHTAKQLNPVFVRSKSIHQFSSSVFMVSITTYKLQFYIVFYVLSSNEVFGVPYHSRMFACTCQNSTYILLRDVHTTARRTSVSFVCYFRHIFQHQFEMLSVHILVILLGFHTNTFPLLIEPFHFPHISKLFYSVYQQ